MKLIARPLTIRSSVAQRRTIRPSPLRVQALFGFGKKNDENAEDKDEMFRAQQELLRERKEKRGTQKAIERRKAVSQYIKDEKVARETAFRDGKNVIFPGKGQVNINTIRKQYGEDDPTSRKQFGIILPLNPIGIPKYDNEERFDVASPYLEKGYVDEKADVLGGVFKNLFGKKKKKDE